MDTSLLLHTAFACMACDGEIAPEEVELIKELASKEKLFGAIDVDCELELLVNKINKEGANLLKEIINEISTAQLTKEEELSLIRVAVKTIQADNIIQYSEIKFFKIIRSHLKVSNEDILSEVSEIDETYLSQDIICNYSALFDAYFNNVEIKDLHINN